eukprot:69351-Rhodomonas_salina.1
MPGTGVAYGATRVRSTDVGCCGTRALFYLLELRIRAPSCSFINVKYTAHAGTSYPLAVRCLVLVLAMRCLVLICGMLLPGDSALPLTEASPLYEILVAPLPSSYAMSGTDIGYAATRSSLCPSP